MEKAPYLLLVLLYILVLWGRSFFLMFYLFLEWGEGREKEEETNIDMKEKH